MHLSSYLSQQQMTAAEFARRIGVKRHHVWKMLHGVSMPSTKVCAAIERETDGLVRSVDFVPLEPQAQAA